MDYISSLPVEITLHIISYLRFIDVARLSQCCTLFSDMLSNTYEYQGIDEALNRCHHASAIGRILNERFKLNDIPSWSLDWMHSLVKKDLTCLLKIVLLMDAPCSYDILTYHAVMDCSQDMTEHRRVNNG